MKEHLCLGVEVDSGILGLLGQINEHFLFFVESSIGIVIGSIKRFSKKLKILVFSLDR